MALLLGLAAVLFTFLGGIFALKKQDKLHLILGFSAGAVVGVAFFDLLPEALELAGEHYDPSLITTFVAAGFMFFMLLSRFISLNPHADEEHGGHAGQVGALSLAIHSFLDGVGIGLAFQVSPAVGLIVAAAVLAHDFSDGINTVSYVLKHKGSNTRAMKWLAVDAIAPLLGVLSTSFFSVPDAQLGLLLAIFCGFFLYIGASDLLPESQHRHPQIITSLATILGAVVIYFAITFAH